VNRGQQRRRKKEIIGQLLIDSYQLSFEETTDFRSVVFQFEPKSVHRPPPARFARDRSYPVVVRLKLKNHGHKVRGLQNDN